MNTNRLIDDVAREITEAQPVQPLRGRVLERLDRRPPVIWRVAALRAAVALCAAGVVIAAGRHTWPRRTTAIVPRPAMHLAAAPPGEAPSVTRHRDVTASLTSRATRVATTGVEAGPIKIQPLLEPAPIRLANIQPAPIQIPPMRWDAIAIDPLSVMPLAASQTGGVS